MTITPEQADVITQAIESSLIDVHTALPGKIQSYDATTKTATIELQIKSTLPKEDGTYTTEKLPVLENVRVGFIEDSDFFISLPCKAGTTGQVIFNELSLDQWRSKNEVTSPGDIGRHTLTGAVFYPMLSPDKENTTDKIDNDLVVGHKGGQKIRVKETGTVEITDNNITTTAAGFVAMASLVDAFIQVFDTVMRTGWTPVAQDGGLALKNAYLLAFPTPPANTPSTNLKAD